jgi:hypothetical protein
MIVLSSEHPQGPQVEFFLKDMAMLQRSVTPWVIVHLHRSAASHRPRCLIEATRDPLMQAAFHILPAR